MEYWEKVIKGLPSEVDSGQKSNKDSLSPLITVNHTSYIEDRAFGTITAFLTGGILILIASLALMLDDNAGLVFLIACIPGVSVIAYGLFSPRKQLRLDRLNDRVILSRPLFLKDKFLAFSTAHALKTYSTPREGIIDARLLLVPKKGVGTAGGTLTKYNLEKYWNFIVWYMDENRPLPPDTAFDPYRQKDFDRRKAAGFPKPLYPATVKTPEANPEQQAERRRIGGW